MGGDQVGPPYPTEPVQARIPQGTGPFSLSIRSSGRQQTHQDGDRAVSPKRGCSFTTCRAVSHRYWPAAAAHQKRIWPIGWAPAFQAGQRGFDSPYPLQFGCVRAPGAHDRPRERLGAMCWINALAQRANRVGMPPPAIGHSRIGVRPGDGTGIRACLRNRILGVRLSPGAPVSQRSTSGEVTSLSSWPDGFDPRTLYQAVALRMRVKACATSVAAK